MEKIFLVGIHQKKSSRTLKDSINSLEELERLSNTVGGEVVGKTLQSLASLNPSTLIGKGKVEELKNQALKKEFMTLIFDEELKSAQQKNLAEIIPAKILDRTRLILDIFAKRARTREGILQVELAQLSYLLPRMTERYGRFEQQVGGIGTRGPGERKLEVEARHIRDRMALLNRELKTIKLHREIARERRHLVPLPIITIVGYTNAGKSTLLNKLVQLYGQSTEPIYADNKLFATLDPTTRRIRLPSGRWALFTDTVGFINKLPHNLIAAFRSTLEETLDADLLIHLVDVSDKNWVEHFKTVIETLNSLEKNRTDRFKQMIIAYNKIDLISAKEKNQAFQKLNFLVNSSDQQLEDCKPIFISAAQGSGINALLNCIENRLSKKMIDTNLYVPFKKAGILHSLYRLGKVESVTHQSRGIHLHLKLERSHWHKVQKLLGERIKTK